MSSGSAVSVAYRNRASEVVDKHLFTAVFVIGAVLIICLKLFHARQLIVTGVAVLCMLVYGAYILFTPRYRIRSDRAGDSLYYLGFLFTMVTLAYSLWEFSSERGGTQAIVTNFGIALATTIFGLMLRVAYHQMREDPFEVERQVRIELSDAAGKLRGELLSSVTALKVLSTGLRQALQESTDGTTRHIAKVVEQTSEAYSKAVGDLTALAHSHAVELQKHQAAMRRAAERTSDAVDRLGQRLENVNFPTEGVAKQLDNLTKVVEASVATTSGLLSSEEKRLATLDTLLSDAESHVQRYSDHLKVLEAEIGGVSRNVQAVGSALDKLTAAAKTSSEATVQLQTEHVKSQQKLLGELQTTVNEALRVTREHRSSLERDVEASSQMLHKVQDSLVGLTRTIITKLDA